MKNHCPVYPDTPLSPPLEYIKKRELWCTISKCQKNDLGSNYSVKILQNFRENTRDGVFIQ